ncbi:UNVERIFIED_CONTAM: hypothetical protein HDU68_008674 [Siphonaria sp. JEL0065]|nr:hypothetical protein HDU68_008674 [Siphonaria sp. JEL0065]
MSSAVRNAGIVVRKGIPGVGVPINVGDLAQVRREPCVIIRLPSTADPTFESIAASGHSIKHSLKEISFLSPNWSSQVPKLQLESLSSTTTRIPIGVTAESTGLLEASHIPVSILSHLSNFDTAVDRIIHEKTAKFSKVYAHFQTHDSVTVFEVACWVFKGIDGALFQQHESTTTTSELDRMTALGITSSELCATQIYLSRNPKWFIQDSAATSLHVELNARFKIRNEDGVSEMVWLEKQAKGSKPGQELKLFLEKAKSLIEWAVAHPALGAPPDASSSSRPNIVFTDSDHIFIKAIKSAAFHPSTLSKPNALTDLVNRGILSRLPHGYARKGFRSAGGSVGPSASGRGLDAIRLLKDLGVLTHWENPSVYAANTEGGALDALDGHNLSEWADQAVLESGVWGRKLVDGPSFHGESPSESGSGNVGGSQDTLVVTAESLAAAAAAAKDGAGYDLPALLKAVRQCTIAPHAPIQDLFFERDAFESTRRDFGNLPVYVIDSPTAQELDDGISIEETSEGTWIHAHIADPTAYMPPGHPLSLLAQLRGTTLYLPERHYPMIPDFLSNARFNLGKSHCALTFSCRLGSDGEIVDYKVSPSIIKNVKILHYRTVNNVLDWSTVFGKYVAPEDRMPWVQKAWSELQPPETAAAAANHGLDEASISDLRKLQKLVYTHMKLRVSRGGFTSDQPNFDIKVVPYPQPITPTRLNKPFEYEDKQPSPPLILLDPNSTSHLEPASNMVSECMIMANRVASKFCTDRGIPSIYRGQAPLKAAASSAQEGIVQSALDCIDPVSGVMPYTAFRTILPFFSPATISMNPAAHSSLGIRAGGTANEFGGYMKVTSPLRRFKDMMLHWLMKEHLLTGSTSLFDADDVAEISIRVHEIEKRTNKISSKSSRYWALEWVSRREVLWRCGGSEQLVRNGVESEELDPKYKGFGIGMAGMGVGPRGPVVWGEEYRGNVEWGNGSGHWEVGLDQRCERPTYQFILGSIVNSRFGLGILGDLGGLAARIDLREHHHVGDIITCCVESVDPVAGVLIMKEW